MSWYKGYYGSWNEPNGIQHIDGTSDRKKMFDEAQATANRLGVEVTVIRETGSSSGLMCKTYTITPELTKEAADAHVEVEDAEARRPFDEIVKEAEERSRKTLPCGGDGSGPNGGAGGDPVRERVKEQIPEMERD